MSQNKPAVFVARRIFPDIVERLRQHAEVEETDSDEPLPPAQLIQRLQGKAGLFATGTERIDAALLDACPQLRAVCLMTVGYNNVDLAACTARGVRVSNAPDVLTETTADFGFALMMAAARRISESERYLREGRWKDRRQVEHSGSLSLSAILATLDQVAPAAIEAPTIDADPGLEEG